MKRRQFLQAALAGAAAFAGSHGAARGAEWESALEQAHGEIWRRFVDKHGVLVDFTNLDGVVDLPTPDECRAGKPNALGWFQPIENGAMFNGLYLDAAVNRWRRSKAEADAAKARRLMEGLLLLNSISQVKGFVGRGVSTDGVAHFPMGSNDQTLPWYFGLWRYLDAGPATAEERKKIVRHLTETTAAILKLDWQMPAEPPFGVRGSFQGFHFDEAPRQLFVLKLMHALTGEADWQTQYLRVLEERGGEHAQSKLEVCQQGMKFWYAKTHNWTSCCAVAALRALWELEQDPSLKDAYAHGLAASAKLAAESLPLAEQFDRDKPAVFDPDWRKAMLPLWKPQTTEAEAVALAQAQLREFVKISPRRNDEASFIREPAAAAWIVTLCPNTEIVRQHAAEIQRLIARYDYAKLYYVTFFWVESAALRLV